MLPETRAKLTAERLLLLTESLGEALVAERYDEVPGLIASRQSALDQLGTMKIDAMARAILERVTKVESDLVTLMRRTQSEDMNELARHFQGAQQVKAYRNPHDPRRLLRTG